MARATGIVVLVKTGLICFLLALMAQSLGCAYAYYIHAREAKLEREAVLDTGCPTVSIESYNESRAKIRGCGAMWICKWQEDHEPTGFLSTDHGHWQCR